MELYFLLNSCIAMGMIIHGNTQFNRHLWRITFVHSYACTRSHIFKETHFCESDFLILTNKLLLTKLIDFSKSALKRRWILSRKHFAIFLCHLTFSISAWKGGCTISFELQVLQISLTLFLKALKTFYQDSKQILRHF